MKNQGSVLDALIINTFKIHSSFKLHPKITYQGVVKPMLDHYGGVCKGIENDNIDNGSKEPIHGNQSCNSSQTSIFVGISR